MKRPCLENGPFNGKLVGGHLSGVGVLSCCVDIAFLVLLALVVLCW
jgi:hypothetical protein